MHPERLQAFVLGTRDYGDTDRIVSLFTLEHGRIRSFARGARKSRKRFGAALEAFARIEVQVRLKEGLCGLTQAEIHSIYPRIRGDLNGIAHALYACELVEAISPEGHPLPRLYRLLSAYLDRLEATAADTAERRFFEINLLNILGYRPSLETCSRCDTPFGGTGALLSEGGELNCRFCAGSGRPVSAATLSLLLSCLATGTFGSIPFSAETTAQAGALLDQAIAAQVGRRLKSVDFLQQVS
ncbi:DNA repair protein RecO [Geobacter sp. SVR]|uniref:DNA repair protein RecO n=1 Tax=Geobacter sp. SVR TaxID=2495594 RepID=UPI00143F04D6|nr:DNA repair protein RecO [Geobacter sp. SVR]BCS55256.1 DNA repair protein RecO [Geobacter sp. SVR]GCF86055.1 DNA repair protein RecO [Geobacter sp. SVR]